MKNENHFDSLTKLYAGKFHLPWVLIKAQIWQESRFNPSAVSHCGAKGLMQLMPETDFWLDHDYDGFNPEGNIENGVRYDRWLYDRFPEIPNTDERMKFMLASYNCGRGYVNAALRLARVAEFGFQPKVLARGEWQTWEYSRVFLGVPACQVNGKHPDYQQVWDYVDKVWKKYLEYRESAEG